jgi:hypothetical protein
MGVMVLGLFGLTGLACSGAVSQGPGPTALTSQSPPAIAQIHRSRCGACHKRVEPGERTREEFESAFVRHRKRVHLSEEQWGELVDYLAPAPAVPAS